MILISTIICTYNRADVLKICLEKITLQEADPATFEVIIIDNNSIDHTADIVKTFISSYTGQISFHYFLEKKQGLSAARNRGLKESKGMYINYIDDDAMIPQDYINQLVHCIQSNSEYDGYGGKITPHFLGSEPSWMSYYTWGLVSKHDLGNEPLHYKSIGIYPTGCNMTYKKSSLEEVGGFDEELLRRCDDKYIAYEIKKQGKKILYCPNVQLDHLIDEDRLTNRLAVICKDTGWHEKVRLRNSGYFIKLLKLVEYVFKLIASLIIGMYYLIQLKREKAIMVIKMRWWFLVGYIYTS